MLDDTVSFVMISQVACDPKRILGKTTSVEPDGDLSVEVLTRDLVDLIQTIFPDPATAHNLLVRLP
jgi:hypothetical protein